MNNLAAEINTYDIGERFEPKYNTYALSLYNTLQLGKFSWFTETAYKTEDVLRNVEVDDTHLFNPANGVVLYNSLTYSQKGLGIVVEGKYTKNFDFRVSPNEILNKGLIHYIPALNPSKCLSFNCPL